MDSSVTRDATMIQKILKSYEDSDKLESALNENIITLSDDLVVQSALCFFNWASKRQGYGHESRAYNEMLDILGRMKQINTMRHIFGEIPKERAATIINEKTFAVLLNRYAAAHKVEDAIEIFYKRKDYGFELDLSLFLLKKYEFPPVIKSRNIILNGRCVLGSLREAKRFWNDIISSRCKPDLFTYGIFINSLSKAGKLGTAVKLFTAMWKKGCQPDVTICNCIIDALCFKKRIPEALEIFGETNERGCLPDVATYNSLIKHLCKIRRMEKVRELLDEMEQKGCLPNSRTYSYILKTMKKPEEVVELLQCMKRGSCKIDSDTYNLILNLYVRWNYHRGVQTVWTEMETCGLGPDQRSYTIMVHGLHSQGKLDEALHYFFKSLP
ncbi:Tetratricopeptide-like helical domain-containing protein [Dioscorea alata]|uniref:Tetratricopeptide-like helical domain-containing protein n=1 Tax=Dioscorea alata TaxID=55571 RepID=A0ACB7UXY4_DIOAL|nr:Tetratricopeptide-like helical domain-containing protein [Dioscorea alata]